MAKAGIVYVGTADGLATYTDPSGKGSWRRREHNLAGRQIRAILAVDDRTLIVAPVGGEPLFTADGGLSWGAAPAGDAERLQSFLDAEGAILNTAQGPAHWKGEHTPAPGAVALALLAGKDEVMLAAIAGGTSLMRSEDGGATWQQCAVEGGLKGGVSTIVPSSYHMDYAWAGTDAGQLLRSDDRGRTWREVGAEPSAITSLAVVRIESAS
jgi:photosystem II stability/assembly factor-like uncharacterized protein